MKSILVSKWKELLLVYFFYQKDCCDCQVAYFDAIDVQIFVNKILEEEIVYVQYDLMDNHDDLSSIL